MRSSKIACHQHQTQFMNILPIIAWFYRFYRFYRLYLFMKMWVLFIGIEHKVNLNWITAALVHLRVRHFWRWQRAFTIIWVPMNFPLTFHILSLYDRQIIHNNFYVQIVRSTFISYSSNPVYFVSDFDNIDLIIPIIRSMYVEKRLIWNLLSNQRADTKC